MDNKSSNPVDDDGDDEDGYAYPLDMHPAEKEDYLAAIRVSKQEEQFRQGGVYGMVSKQFAGGASASSQPQYRYTQSLQDPLRSPPVPMPHKNTKAK
ncbi:unnamed protein product [Prunus armeniaca]